MPGVFVLGAGCRLSENSVFYIFATYVLAYGEAALQIPRATTLTAVNIAAASWNAITCTRKTNLPARL